MSQKIKTSVEIDGSLTASQIANATTDTDKFLVSDGGTVKYRTGAELASDLGIASGSTSKVQHQVKAGVAINKGQAVYVTSADGTNMIVGLASNASEATSSKTMGLLNATVVANGFADVVTEGLLDGLDTSTATVGNPVWLGTGGNLIYGLANKPYAPNHLVFIGIVTRVNANNGEIFVKVQNGFELDEIHDVDLKTTAKINGHLLGYNGSLWVNKTIAEWLGYTPYNASNPAGYISSYTETDTLASVTARGALTNTPIAISAGTLNHVTLGDRFNLIGGSNLHITNNAYYDSGFKYKFADLATKLALQADGILSYQTAVTGTVGSAVTFDTKFSVDSSGNLIVPGTLTASGYNKTNWDTAYGWGNHASAGYATSGHTHIISPVAESSVSPNGISIQAGPGSSNPQGWTYPYGTKLSAISGAGRSFEIMSTTYPDGQLVLRTLGSSGVWDSWKTILDTSNYSTYAVPLSRTITINGTSYDLSANRSWTVTGTETDTLATVTARGASTGTAVTLTSSGNNFNGHHYFTAYDANGNHYPHYNNGSNNNGSKLNLRMFDTSGNAVVFYLNGADKSIQWNGNNILHAGNYNSYSPTLTGGNASGTWGINITGNSSTVSGITNNTGLLRDRLAASALIDGLTTSNFRTTLFGSGSNGYQISTSRFNSVPSPLSGLNMYGTMFAWSGADTHGFIAMDYSTAGVKVGGGNGESINWSKTLAFGDGTGASGTWGINITGNASYASNSGIATTAGSLQTARAINGTFFDGSANISTTEWFHSDRDFPSGTLITTSINYANSEGDPFILEIRGNTYGNIIPHDIQVQGYIYANTIINVGGLSNGRTISGLVALNVGGNLCFWFPSQGYWNGYNVKVYTAYATRAVNRVTSITGGAKPSGTKEVALSASIRQSLHTDNYNAYTPTLTGAGASGTWGINITGSAGSASSATYSTNATRLYASDSPYRYGDGTPYYLYMNYDGGSYWELKVSPATPGAVRVAYANSAGTSSQLGGIDSSRFVYGDNANGRSKDRSNGSANASDDSNSSGFYFGYNVAGMPGGDWWTWMTAAGGSWSGGDGYRWQMANSFWSDDLRVRRMTSGSWSGWNRVYTDAYRPYTDSAGSAARATRANGNFYIDDNYGNTVVGAYSASRFQGVFAMGNAYKLAADGTSCADHYGIAWSHPNAGGQAANLSSHGMLVQQYGVTMAAISTNIWCSGDVIAYSDARVKDNVEVIDNPLERIKKVRGVTFTRTDLDDKDTRHAGVIAQEMREALPEVVSENSEGNLSVSYGNSIALLIECIKEQQTQIDELKELVNKLINK